MPIKATREEFLEKYNKLEISKYFKIVSKFDGYSKPIIVRGEFAHHKVDPWNILNEFTPSIITALDKTEYFINFSIKIHGKKYDYSLVVYTGNKNKVKIICPKKGHGVFEQRPNDHMMGHGCRKCGIELGQGYDINSFIRACQVDDAILYIIKCSNENEVFYKMGITGKSPKQRFCSTKQMPYNYEVIYEFSGLPDYIYNLEHDLHFKYKEYKYRPLINFAGYTECYNSKFPFEELMELLRGLLKKRQFGINYTKQN